MCIRDRIQAIIRRTYDFGRDLNTLNCRGVTLNLGDGVVSFGEEKLELSRNEYKILEILMKKKGNVVPREEDVYKRQPWMLTPSVPIFPKEP